MEDDFDIKCLPTEFVGISKPSKVIDAILERKEKEEKNVIEELHVQQQIICKNYEQLIENQSEELKRNLDNIKGLIKNELYDAKIKTNQDNANSFEKLEFKNIYKRIQDYFRRQHDLVEAFYWNLVATENDKSKEFTDALKKTYEEIKRISFRQPGECDELIEAETEKVNQTILCNNRNYVELRAHLEAEIKNHHKIAIQELQQIKERWIKFIRSEMQKTTSDLRKHYVPYLTDVIDQLQKKTEEVGDNLRSVDTIYNTQNARAWLDNLRLTLAMLDQKGQKLIISYKQATVIIYNRFYEELKVIEETLAEMNETENVSISRAEMYTPDLKDITNTYNVELETIQRIWNDLVEELTKTLDTTYKFLMAASTLWKKHFKRTEILQIVILKDIENTIQTNNSLAEPHEIKLNILIDTLRQEPTREKLKKTLEDIKKQLVVIENVYKSQYSSEVAVFKKYKNTHELRTDVLLAEIKRFLAVYPPDREKDPKIQRKRASQTSEVIDPTEGLIPAQMIFCKYQIGAISNWQFGMWECINNYITNVKAELLAEVEEWVQKKVIGLDRRLTLRLGIHALRMEKIQAYIYDERLEELCEHQSRFDEHKTAVERQLGSLKEELKSYGDIYEHITIEFKNETDTIQTKSSKVETSYAVASLKPVLNANMEKSIKETIRITSEYMEKCNAFASRVKASHLIFTENMKLFSESGNFSIQEAKDFLKHMEKLEVQVNKVITDVKKEAESNKEKLIETIQTTAAGANVTIKAILEELKFVEALAKKQKNLQRDLIREVCSFQYKFKTASEQFEKSKKNIIAKGGEYSYLKEFAEGVKEMIEKLTELTDYLNEATPVRLYSDKSTAVLPPQSSHVLRTQRTQADILNGITSQLFNFEILQDRNTIFMNLSKILLKYWDEIKTFGKRFYASHNDSCFYLDKGKIPQNLAILMKDMYRKFSHIQTQCETRSMQDTKEYLDFAFAYLTFLEEYIETYIEEYARKTLSKFESKFETEVRQALLKNEVNINRMYEDLQKKLKPLYGHPKNKRLLENLQIEAEIIYCEAKEIFANSKAPVLDILEQEFNEAVYKYNDLKRLVPEVAQTAASFRIVIEGLRDKLNEKVELLRMMVNFCPSEDATSTKDVILSHCKSFLTSYDSKSTPYLAASSNVMQHLSQKSLSESALEESSESMESLSLVKASVSTGTTYDTEEADVFMSDMKERYNKYCKEVYNKNYDVCLDALRNEWSWAVERVLALYKVKYDQYRT